MWFIIRHGQTMHNLKGIRQGRCPSLLTLKGIDQIKSIAYRISSLCDNFENYKIITSPMIRTRHSAQIISEILEITDAPIIEDENINEIDCGELSNTKKEILVEKYSYIDEEKNKDLFSFRYPGGESYQDVLDRIKIFFEKYKEEKNLIIVTHGADVKFIKFILEKNKIENFENIKIDQNYCFCWDGNKIIKI